jgi:hypothetical protein
LATSQYADVVVGLYLLISCHALIKLQTDKSSANAVFAGLNFGFLTFIKEEGLLIGTVLLILAIWHLLSTKNNSASLKNLLISFFVTAFPTIFIKLALAPNNRYLFLLTINGKLPNFNLDGYFLILYKYIQIFTDHRFYGIWIFLSILFLCNFKKYFSQKAKLLTAFYAFFFLGLTFLYLTTPEDLAWKISASLPRVLNYILPSMLFYHFYVWNLETKNAD